MKKLLTTLLLLASTIGFSQVVELDCPVDISEHTNMGVFKSTQILSSCPSNSSLVTFYATNNSQRGVMFDLQGITSITILCFDVNLSVGTSNVAIYTKVGTHVGFQNTPGAWTLIGTALNVVSAGVNLPTYIPIAVNTPIGVGGTQAFYITRTTVGGPTVAYTNGVLVGNILASDANLRILEGTGKEYLFSTSFAPRDFNGRIYYSLGNVLPIELVSFTGVKKACNQTLLNWTTATERNNDHFDIERCTDGVSFVKIGEVKGSGNSLQTRKYEYVDLGPNTGINYYRLKQVDYDGKSEVSPIISVDNSCENNVRTLIIMNILGEKVDESYSGLIFIYKSDNTVTKQLQNAN